jgi:hypothetical protein
MVSKSVDVISSTLDSSSFSDQPSASRLTDYYPPLKWGKGYASRAMKGGFLQCDKKRNSTQVSERRTPLNLK